MSLYNYFRISKASQNKISADLTDKKYKTYRNQTFWSITIAYSLYYFCRMAFNIVKQPMLDEKIFTEGQLGIIGSVMLISYAFGKFFNGFIADYCNIKRFMAVGLLFSLIINIIIGILGFSYIGIGLSSSLLFLTFLILWAVNGWSQSMGAPPAVISLSRWFPLSKRGFFYSILCSTPYLGKALFTILCATIVSATVWQYGFFFSAFAGLIGVILIIIFVKDTPESCGLPSIQVLSGEELEKEKSTKELQRGVIFHPSIWIIALSSAFIYITQYAITGWGILFLQKTKDFSLFSASKIISIAEIFGVFGTISAGFLSDKVFGGSRIKPVILCGLLSFVALWAFLFTKGDYWLNIVYVAVFSIAIGVLYCIVAGIMALDIVPRKATGAALGIVGISSYLAAGVQDIISGFMIQASSNNFDMVASFWLLSCLFSFVLPILAWKYLKKKIV